MTDEKMLAMMADVDSVLMEHRADVSDVLAVADRLIVSSIRNVSEERPDVDVENVLRSVLDRIGQHVRRELKISVDEIMN